MSIHQDIILDLLPTYYAGEASDASTKLIESYFADNPEFARAMHAAQHAGPVIPRAEQAAEGMQAMNRVKKAVKLRSAFLGASIGFSLAPLSFIYDSDKGLAWLMIRDAPLMAAVYIGAAVGMWLAYYAQRRKV
jgi:hypothetical protein